MSVDMSVFASTIYNNKYAEPGETWEDTGPNCRSTARRVVEAVMGPYFPELVEEFIRYIVERKFLPGGRYLYAAGKAFHQTQNCLLLAVEDSREAWASLMQRVTNGLMTGAGIGVVYSKLRECGAPVRGMGGTSTGPLALMEMVNEAGRHIMQGGSRRSAIWAGLNWTHPDIYDFIEMKNWSKDVRRLKEQDFNFPARMDGTNISVLLDDAFFAAYNDPNHIQHRRARKVYQAVIERMLTTGEPGFSIDVGDNAGEVLRNACTELTSADDNDICNLGSINLARIDSLLEMHRVVKVATAFLLSGTLYSKVPYAEVAEVRNRNRRLGLGVMGIAEWLAVRGKPYAPDDELQDYLTLYTKSGEFADRYADRLGISRPVKTRAIAPTGTIGILGETTTGIEPIFAKAIKRRYLKGSEWHYQYVIDAAVKRLVDRGVSPDAIEDAYDLAREPGRRLAFQAWVQEFVDHGISSTINLPEPSQQSFTHEEFGDTLMQYLPQLRGVTVYPDGARGGQPLTTVPYAEAIAGEGMEYRETGNELACVSGACGI